MRRRLILVFGTFVMLLLAMGVYNFFAGGGKYFDPETNLATTPSEDEEAAESQPAEFLVTIRDDEGRLERIIRASPLQKQPDGTYLALDPSVEAIQEDGQRIILSADRGIFYVEELDTGINPRRGKLEGNVRIVFDRSTDPDPVSYTHLRAHET